MAFGEIDEVSGLRNKAVRVVRLMLNVRGFAKLGRIDLGGAMHRGFAASSPFESATASSSPLAILSNALPMMTSQSNFNQNIHKLGKFIALSL